MCLRMYVCLFMNFLWGSFTVGEKETHHPNTYQKEETLFFLKKDNLLIESSLTF